MPANNFVTKPVPSGNFKINKRATIGNPMTPVSFDVNGGPNTLGAAVSGVRVNYPSGTMGYTA